MKPKEAKSTEQQLCEIDRSMRGRVGLGDVIQRVLDMFGITEERFKKWFNLTSCNCSKRRGWLNSLLSWKKKGSD